MGMILQQTSASADLFANMTIFNGLINYILPITLFIGIILICVRLGAIIDLLEEQKNDIQTLTEISIKKNTDNKK